MKPRATSTFTVLIIGIVCMALYLSAPLPQDSVGCCEGPSYPIPDYFKGPAFCNSPDTSSCFQWNPDQSVAREKLCFLYAPSTLRVEACSDAKIATCFVRGSSIQKYYYGTGTTPWDLSTATTDCTGLGGMIE